MPEITFVFGPNNTFFFDSPKSWKFHNIPPTLRQLFNSSMDPGWRVAQPFCLALGPQINSPEPIWYCGCRVLNGEEKLFYSQSYFDFNYPDLSRWTKTIPDAPRACFITFGTALSYFACAQGRGSTWAGVSSELTDKVQKAYDTPCCVSLGMNNAWFVMWPDGYYAWKFYGNYGALDKILKDAPPRSVSYLAISPYNKEHYFVAFRDRTVKYNFVGVPEWLPQMQEVFTEWQAEIMQNQGYPPPISPVQPQFNQYLPTPGQPAYVAAHYANSPPIPPYAPLGGVGPQQAPVELPGTMLAPPPANTRPSSIYKKKGFLSKRASASVVAPVVGTGVLKAAHFASEGSQTCNVQ